MSDKKTENAGLGTCIAFGIAMGAGFGIALGGALHNIALGMALGVATGVAVGMVFWPVWNVHRGARDDDEQPRYLSKAANIALQSRGGLLFDAPQLAMDNSTWTCIGRVAGWSGSKIDVHVKRLQQQDMQPAITPRCLIRLCTRSKSSS